MHLKCNLFVRIKYIFLGIYCKLCCAAHLDQFVTHIYVITVKHLLLNKKQQKLRFLFPEIKTIFHLMKKDSRELFSSVKSILFLYHICVCF